MISKKIVCIARAGVRYFTCKKIKMFKLSGTHQDMPMIGLGTWQAKNEEVESMVYQALEVGYRHIDTAFNYDNEEAIGNAIRKWIEEGNGNREELFITTKLPHVGNRSSDVQKYLTMSLDRLKMSYVDLYLVHLPFGFIGDPITHTPVVLENGEYQLDMATSHIGVWKAMESAVTSRLAKNIGLSNFNVKQIEAIYKFAKIKPQVLQVECHAHLQQQELRSFCNKNAILLTAYSPLGSPGAKHHFTKKYGYSPDVFPNLLQDPVVIDLSVQRNRTPAQILLRYLVQMKICVIPKSSSVDRLKENFDVFTWELTPSDMNSLKKLDMGDRGRIFDFLFWKGVERHPHYPFAPRGAVQPPLPTDEILMEVDHRGIISVVDKRAKEARLLQNRSDSERTERLHGVSNILSVDPLAKIDDDPLKSSAGDQF